MTEDGPNDLKSHLPEAVFRVVESGYADVVRPFGRRSLPYFCGSSQTTTVVPSVGAVVPKYPVRWVNDIPLDRWRALIIKTVHTRLKVGSP